MPIVTLEEVKAFRGIDHSDHDQELDRLIVAAQTYVEGLCRRKLDRNGNQADLFSGGETWDPVVRELRLTRPPVRSLATIHDDPLRVYGASTLLGASNYVLVDADAGIVRFDGYTPNRGIQNIRVVYDGGFKGDEASLEPLKEALIELIWAARNKGFENSVGVRSKSIADGNLAYLNNDWPMNLLPILEQYKLDWVA